MVLAAVLFNTAAYSQSDKDRLIIFADMGHDPDEEQQIVHLLACSNEFELEGLIAVTGYYFRADPPSHPKELWPHLFLQLIDGYAKVYPNLMKHASGWQTPEYLRSIVSQGQAGTGMSDVGKGKSSPGSKLVTAAVLKNDPRPLHIIVNSGSNTLAQALFDYRESHSQAEVKAFVSKIRVMDNGAQDESGAWICNQFPDIHWVRSSHQNRTYGGPTNSELGPSHVWKPYANTAQGQDDWAKEHVRTGHGALGALYPQRKVGGMHFIEGGGTSPFMRHVARGLADPSEPAWGGWSGRFSRVKHKNPLSTRSIVSQHEKQYQPFAAYSDHSDISDKWKDPVDGKTYDNVYAGGWRWRAAMWNDFKARMDWSVEPFEKANHHPRAAINGDTTNAIIKVYAKPGDKLNFDASASSDPDNDELDFSWWHYLEAGQNPWEKPLTLVNSDKPSVSITVPEGSLGKEMHIILEVTDRSPIAPLTDYRRVVIHSTDKPVVTRKPISLEKNVVTDFTHGKLHVSYQGAEAFQVRLYDVLNREILPVSTTHNGVFFDVKAHSTGIFILSLRAENAHFVQKLRYIP